MRKLFFYILIMCGLAVQAQTEYRVEAQSSASGGDYTPLWLNANKHGLSSLDKSNGYLRAGVFRGLQTDSTARFGYGYGADLAVAYNFTSTLVVQQAYVEGRWLKGVLTVGSKEQPLELKNQQLSTGAQTLGINARPVPQVRLSLPDYWDVPYTNGWLGLKGHIAYGMTTDDHWQADFIVSPTKYTKHALYHGKAGYLRLGKGGHPLTVEAGLEMAAQFGGESYLNIVGADGWRWYENESGLSSFWHAFKPGGGDSVDHDYHNAEGNTLGSWVARVSYDAGSWALSIYGDHFFEDQSSMFMLDYDGYGTGSEWNVKKDNRFLLYDLKDIMLGAELKLKRVSWLNDIVVEYLHTTYQSGPVYHDHTPSIPDHVGGLDNYYRHYVYTGWQHWGQAIGNPLYRSPLYNTDGVIDFYDTRFVAWHLGLSGHPVEGLDYRVLATWQRGYGTYLIPLPAPQENVSLLAEAVYRFAADSKLGGWSVRLGLAMDRGELLGDNTGVQLTIAKSGLLNQKRRNQ